MTSSRATALLRPRWGRIRFLSLTALGALIAHDAVFAAQYGLGGGFDAAMGDSHRYWPAFVAVTLLVTLVVAVAAGRALLRLGRLVGGLPVAAPARGGRTYLAELARLWPRLFAVVVLAFLLQENVEHATAGEPMPGLWALSAPGYPLALPVIALVTGLLAAAGSWLQWRRDTLVARLRAARSALARLRPAARSPHHRWALLAALLVHRWTLLRRDAERAPPTPSAA